jgi:hypothetical protein
MFQNIGHIKSGNVTEFFETNAFYPNKLSLFFSDLLIPQSLTALPLTFFTNNPILVFNLVLLLTLILNYWSLFIFWKLIFKTHILAFLGAIFFIFGPFLVLQQNHPQMLSFWPFFLALYFWFKDKRVLVGVALAVQFLASVYLVVYLLVALAISALLKHGKVKDFLIVVLVFLMLDGVFIGGYIGMKNMYGFVRNRAEYEMYAAHLTDYFFTTDSPTIFGKTSITKRWNSFDLHVQGEKGKFPGIVLSLLALAGLVKIALNKKIKINFVFDKKRLFFLIIMILGLVNSLGTRVYGVPTLYVLIGRYFPFADSIRAMARWNFLLYFGLTFFALEGLKKIKSSRVWLILVVIFLAESLPFFASEARDYKTGYEEIKEVCQAEKKVLLEIPVTHFGYSGGAIAGIDYLTRIHLSSLYHGCYLYNGYGSYQPQNLFDLEDKIYGCLQFSDKKCFSDLMNDREIGLVKFNQEKWQEIFGQKMMEF